MPEPVAGGAAIRSARRRAGITLRQLAADLGVSIGTMSAIENDKVGLTVERLHRIARRLGVSAAGLLEPQTLPDDEGAEEEGAEDEGTASRPGPGRTRWRTFDDLGLGPVLGSAVEVFNETGYHGATMRVIATGADISVPGIYHHYPSKQHLLVALLDIALRDLEWRIVAAGGEVDGPVERFAVMVEALALFHAERPEFASLVLSEIRSVEEPNRGRLVAAQRRVRDALADAAAGAVSRGRFAPQDVGTTVRAITTMCVTLPYWFPESDGMGSAQLARHYSALAVDMMGLVPR